MKILFMDDDDAIRGVVSEMLEYLGHNIDTASCGVEALKLCQKQLNQGDPYDIAILDLSVHNGMGGDICVNRLRSITPKVKTVIATSHSEDPILKDYRSNGFDAALPKPFTVSAIENCLNKFMA
jgi:CheY-like chemotaxis protein